MPAKRLFIGMMVLLGMVPGTVHADDLDGAAQVETEQAKVNVEVEAPSLEMLEFLGQWETGDGDWIDPAELETMKIPEEKPKDKDDE
ncbi:MAG: hypothetical protein ACE5E9_11090 [Nitrospinaceae bacterium]